MSKIKISCIAIVIFLAANIARAGILYEWNFSKQADGTALRDVASADQPYTYFSATPLTSSLTVSNGNLIVDQNGAQQNGYVGLSGFSSGTYYLVVEVAGWTTAAAGGYMDLRFNRDNTTGGTLSGIRFCEHSSGQTYLQLMHSASLANVVALKPNNTSQNLIIALELNLDDHTTTVHYKLGDAKWREYPRRSPKPGNIQSIRFVAGKFSSGSQISVKRVAVSDVFPVPGRSQ